MKLMIEALVLADDLVVELLQLGREEAHHVARGLGERALPERG